MRKVKISKKMLEKVSLRIQTDNFPNFKQATSQLFSLLGFLAIDRKRSIYSKFGETPDNEGRPA